MSQENVDVVRRGFEAWNRNDWDALMALYDDDVVSVPPEGWPDGSITIGREALRQEKARLKESWSEERVEVDELRDLGDRVLSGHRWIASGKDSGVETMNRSAALFTLRRGKIVHEEHFFDQSKALEALGLRE